MSTHPHEDRAFLDKPENAYLTKAQILKWEEGRTLPTDWAAHHFFNWAEWLDPSAREEGPYRRSGIVGGPFGLVLSQRVAAFDHRVHRPLCRQCRASREPVFRRSRLQEREAVRRKSSPGYEARVEKIVGSSAEVLPRLGAAGRRFDRRLYRRQPYCRGCLSRRGDGVVAAGSRRHRRIRRLRMADDGDRGGAAEARRRQLFGRAFRGNIASCIAAIRLRLRKV